MFNMVTRRSVPYYEGTGMELWNNVLLKQSCIAAHFIKPVYLVIKKPLHTIAL